MVHRDQALGHLLAALHEAPVHPVVLPRSALRREPQRRGSSDPPPGRAPPLAVSRGGVPSTTLPEGATGPDPERARSAQARAVSRARGGGARRSLLLALEMRVPPGRAAIELRVEDARAAERARSSCLRSRRARVRRCERERSRPPASMSWDASSELLRGLSQIAFRACSRRATMPPLPRKIPFRCRLAPRSRSSRRSRPRRSRALGITLRRRRMHRWRARRAG